ncbi:MAG: hypothetical protein JRH19_25015, partial [Deltaproteobacteria bacterium]|nr:hypothetical protein [Deltaproteobacteria bacterium]
YFERSGDTIPTPVIDYHTVRFNIYTPMAVAPLVANPMPGLELIQYLGWYWVYSLAPLEVMAHAMGVDVGAPIVPDATPTREAAAHDALVERLRQAASGDDFAAYEMGVPLRMAEYLRRAERFGPALEAEDLAEASALLDRPVTDWSEADRLLEAFVEEAGPERDAELVRFFCRRSRRQVWLLDPVLRELEGCKIQLLDG